jgi:Sulfotransferase family
MEQPAGRVQVLFICGAGRSGSTVLEGLLADALPGALPVGEIRQVWGAGLRHDFACECQRSFQSCPFWSAVVLRLEAGGRVDLVETMSLLRRIVRVGALRGLLRKRVDDDERYLGAALEELYGATAAEGGATTIIDSSKTPQYALFLAKAARLDLHVLHLVRDSRAVAHSWSRTKAFAPQSSQPMQRRTPMQAALRWNRHNALALLLRGRARSYQRITYEELARSPRQTVARAVEGTGLRPDGSLLDEAARGHSFMGNPVRFARPTAAEIVLDDEWRRAMSGRDRITVTAATFPLLRRFGYRMRP